MATSWKDLGGATCIYTVRNLETHGPEMVEISWVVDEQWRIVRQRGHSDQQINRPHTAGLALIGRGWRRS